MSVVIETTIGDVTVDLFLAQRPKAALNFLKLCKLKYYNYNLFHTIQHGFIAQTGDPSGSGDGGSSFWGVLEGKHKRYFEGETVPKMKHTEPGLLSMVCAGEGLIGSQFFFTLGPELISLDGGGHVVIGEVTEGHEVLRKLNETICDEKNRPYKDVRITHTVILEDPFDDPRGFREPSRSPSPSAERLAGGRIGADEDIDDTDGKTAEEIAEMFAEREAKARATILEIVGDIPDADVAPPENVLFVCKLNPVTTDDDLQIIFSRFGKIKGCEVIRDKVSGDSLQYAFIEFEDKKSCEDAYFKMDNVLIDDRRIHVDFSQSVSKVRWRGKGKGIEYFDGSDKKDFKNIGHKDYDDVGYKGRKRTTGSPKKTSKSFSSSRSRSRSPKKRHRSPVRQQGNGGGNRDKRRSPWRTNGGNDNRGDNVGNRDKKVRLSESNTGYREERNGRNIRVEHGKVDYKNRPYPNTFLKRNAPDGRSGTNRGSSHNARRSRSPVGNRQRRRSHDRLRPSRSRSGSASQRRNAESTDHNKSGESKHRTKSPVNHRSRDRSARSRSLDHRSSNRKQSLVDERDTKRNRSKRDVDVAPTRRYSSPPKRKSSSTSDKRKKAKKRDCTSDSSESVFSEDSSSSDDERSKKKKKKSSSKKKIKKNRKRASSDSSSDSSSESSDEEKHKKKSKSKKKKKY
ncbi:peptidyl-prolyl cis-trans isomerase sig-7 [Toxorhynchites rutilus septentrionalis]|uniref:peptidyl-prolyl cis-trans isomerase sig-7 n=1 Tax=Toxorhynchites rutilus septentrionalis TaxID=329112 RepID=UPI00247AD0B5|nr:peptidyl-prolyl cis-trans isomerase sig-7 [Toxorhynchites rutilus septentrionalis]